MQITLIVAGGLFSLFFLVGAVNEWHEHRRNTMRLSGHDQVMRVANSMLLKHDRVWRRR